MSVVQRITADQLLEREEALINALLLPFRNIVELAPLPETELTKEAAAAQCFQMKVETQALVRAAEDLLKLTRELKEYWLMEPLRELNEGEKETTAKMTEDAARVAELFEKFGKKMHLKSHKATESENTNGSEERLAKKSKETDMASDGGGGGRNFVGASAPDDE